MKKLIAIILCLLCPLTCMAQTLVCGGADNETLQQVGTLLSSACGMSLSSVETEEAAANEMLANADTFCLATQQMPIRALQGYADGDPRRDMEAVALVAKDDVFLAMYQPAAEAIGVSDLAGFQAYVTANEYGVTLMRYLDANAYDRACCTLFDGLYVDSEPFYDLEDMMGSVDEEPPYVLLVGAADAAKLAADGYVVLGCMSEARSPFFPELQCAGEVGLPVCQGVWYGVFAPAGVDVSAVAEAVKAAVTDPAWGEQLQSLMLQAATMDDFQSFVTEQCADLVAYMTAEGLFFYEE